MDDYIICGNSLETTGKKIYTLANYNGIVAVTDTVSTLYLDENNPYLNYAYYNIIKYKDKTICVPYREKEILIIYDKDNSTKKISIVCEKERTEEKWFVNSFIYNENVYMFGDSFPGIVIFNPEKEEYKILYIDNINYLQDKRRFFSMGYYIKENYAYIPMGHLGAILEISLINYNYKILKLPIEVDGIDALSYFNDKFYLIAGGKDKGKIIKIEFNYENYELIEFAKRETVDEDIFFPPIMYDEKIYIFPQKGQKSYVIDFTKNLIIDNKSFDNMIIKGEMGLDCLKYESDLLEFQTRTSAKWITYDLANGRILDSKKYTIEDVNIKKILIKKLLNDQINEKITLVEQEGFLDNYISIIVNR